MFDLEQKYARIGAVDITTDTLKIEGYASLFGRADQGHDIVEPGAYAASLARLKSEGRRVKMLWQHDPAQPIGIWDTVREDDRGLYVAGRLLPDVPRAAEAAALIKAGAMDGLSIGYRTIRASRDDKGHRRLKELDLWEVSLVTFPMLPDARVGSKAAPPFEDVLRDVAQALTQAGATLVHMPARTP
ncbi:MAG: HK97 family phage prohead protease [Pseudomonadota bacterium]